jgi:hypothetical protein
MDQRMSVIEAARVLNLSEAAVRARIRRGSLESVRDEDGNVFVMVDPDVVGDAPHDESEDSTRASRELIDTLQEQLRLEREASAELRRLLAVALQRVPEIEASQDAPSEARESPVTASEGESGPSGGSDDTTELRRSWWRRLFEG